MKKSFARTGALIWNGSTWISELVEQISISIQNKKHSPVDIFRKQMTILMFPKHFVILSKWNVIIFIYFIYFPCLQPISFNIKLENNICNPTDQLLYCYSDWFSLLLIRLLFPASNSVSLLIRRATVFRSLICVNRVCLFFCLALEILTLLQT